MLQLMLMLTFPLFLSCSQLRLGHRTGKFELATCNVRQADCERTFSFGKGAQLEQVRVVAKMRRGGFALRAQAFRRCEPVSTLCVPSGAVLRTAAAALRAGARTARSARHGPCTNNTPTPPCGTHL